ncbi:hypothetical protein LZ30DRAFT_437622 [Colletotrichum cereale]|nr:hypothetical protein LZ30DRAFT_437622 [Colletotrichum cereale]
MPSFLSPRRVRLICLTHLPGLPRLPSLKITRRRKEINFSFCTLFAPAYPLLTPHPPHPSGPRCGRPCLSWRHPCLHILSTSPLPFPSPCHTNPTFSSLACTWRSFFFFFASLPYHFFFSFFLLSFTPGKTTPEKMKITSLLVFIKETDLIGR